MPSSCRTNKSEISSNTMCFLPIIRKTDCRNCGGVVCGNCSANKLRLAHISTTEFQRVCNACYSKIKESESYGMARPALPPKPSTATIKAARSFAAQIPLPSSSSMDSAQLSVTSSKNTSADGPSTRLPPASTPSLAKAAATPQPPRQPLS